jgi:hypothetical protein
MKGDRAHRLRAIFDNLHWEKLPDEIGEQLLKDPKFLTLVFTQIISGEIKLDPHQWTISNDTGRLELKLKD